MKMVSGLDSMARFYKNPVMWSDTIHQFSADSIQAVIKDQSLSKINMISNAFIVSQQDSLYYNQIKATEMVAFFSNNEIYRFDALGGASALLFMEEDSVVTIMNHKECKMLTARIKDRTIKRTRYINELKQDAHPIFLVNKEDMSLRGFQWHEQLRPKSRNEVTSRSVRKSWREVLQQTVFPDYYYTGKFFPQDRDTIFAYKKHVDSLILAKRASRQRNSTGMKPNRVDTIRVSRSDSIGVMNPYRDNSFQEEILDTVIVNKKGTQSELVELSKKELRRQKKELRREQRKLRKLQRQQHRLAIKEKRRKRSL